MPNNFCLNTEYVKQRGLDTSEIEKSYNDLTANKASIHKQKYCEFIVQIFERIEKNYYLAIDINFIKNFCNKLLSGCDEEMFHIVSDMIIERALANIKLSNDIKNNALSLEKHEMSEDFRSRTSPDNKFINKISTKPKL